MNAMPGDPINAFCDPPIATSIPHESTLSGAPPTPEMESTMNNAGWSRTTAAMGSMSLITPVEVSECWISTPLKSVSSAACTSAAFAVLPQSYSSSFTSRPYALQIFTKRWPKFPTDTTSTRSPREKQLTTAASIPPLPEHVKVRTSLLVS